METIKYHYPLGLSVNHFIKDYDIIPTLPPNKQFHISSCNPKLYLHDDIYQKLSALGILNSLVFSMVSNIDKGSIHIDLDRSTLEPWWPSLNIVIDGQGIMRWFNPSTPGVVLQNKSAGVFYKTWFKNYGEPIDEWNSGKVVLVRTDVPHQAWNFDNDIRRIVTIRWDKKISWEETIEWFNKNFPSVSMTL
jgi:hypothetical protein